MALDLSQLPMNPDQPAPEETSAPEHPPSRPKLLWMFARWTPPIMLVSLATLWALVLMGGMARVVGWLFIQHLAPGLAVLIGLVVTVYAVIRRRISRPIALSWMLAALVIWPSFWERGWLAFPYPSSLDDSPAWIRPPVAGPLVVYWGGPELKNNYHALYPDQRWAYDLVIQPAGHQSERLEDYGCFGVPIVAPASGTVVLAHDGEPDQTPPKIAPTTQAFGNHVAIKLPSKTYLLIAHLKKGSVAVKAGQNIKEGAPIGACGNSGRTSEPHIHLHHQRQRPDPERVGLSEGLPLFFRNHQGPKMPNGGVEMRDGKMLLKGDTIQYTPPS